MPSAHGDQPGCRRPGTDSSSANRKTLGQSNLTDCWLFHLCDHQANPQLFFLSYDGLKSRLAQEEARYLRNAELIADIETAVQFVEEDFASTLVDFKKLTTQQEITFDLLWALIVPNTLVYDRHDSTEQDRILLARSFDLDCRNGVLYADIECDVITDDGSTFGFARVCLSIPRFAGARKIQELAVYPLDYHRDKYTLRRHAAERGRKFAKMVGPTFREISGQAMRGEKQKFHVCVCSVGMYFLVVGTDQGMGCADIWTRHDRPRRVPCSSAERKLQSLCPQTSGEGRAHRRAVCHMHACCARVLLCYQDMGYVLLPF